MTDLSDKLEAQVREGIAQTKIIKEFGRFFTISALVLLSGVMGPFINKGVRWYSLIESQYNHPATYILSTEQRNPENSYNPKKL